MKINIVDSDLPPHLGGHLNKTHIDEGTLNHLCRKFDITSMLDIGCGPGDMITHAKERGLTAIGVDGDYSIQRTEIVHIHDYTTGKWLWNSDMKFDLGWSVEFLEHVEEKYMPFFMHSFARCEYVVVTAAPPGWPGHHHVNCRDKEYWKGAFAAIGYEYDDQTTQEIVKVSTMKKPFMQNNGMFFRKYHHD